MSIRELLHVITCDDDYHLGNCDGRYSLFLFLAHGLEFELQYTCVSYETHIFVIHGEPSV